jgi:hypothetical protein
MFNLSAFEIANRGVSVEPDQRASLRGARTATNPLPTPAAGSISVQRQMVTRRRLCIGRTNAGKIVTIHVEDAHFRVTCDGVQLSLHRHHEQRGHPVGKPRSTPQALTSLVHSVLSLNHVLSANDQQSPETTSHPDREVGTYHDAVGVG